MDTIRFAYGLREEPHLDDPGKDNLGLSVLAHIIR
jgi:hypothetical protein